MAKMTKGEMAAIYLRGAFSDEDFTYEEAKEYLATTDFEGVFAKASWNSLIKKHFLEPGEEEDTYHFTTNSEDDEDGPVSSDWTNAHRRHFVCVNDNSKSGYGDFFGEAELVSINEMYFHWKELSKRFQYYGCRRINLPEVLSEGLSSALFGWARTNALPLVNIPESADLVDIITGDAIQVKGISTEGDDTGAPTSFGPNTVFDRLIVMHVRLDEDKAYFYELNAQEYKDWKVSGSASLREQQAEGRRPRLLLLPLIREFGLEPIMTYSFK